jgi:hypothetical protein
MDRHLPSTHIQSKFFFDIFHSFKFFFIDLSHVSLDRSFYLLVFLRRLRISLCTKSSQMMLNQLLLNLCYPKFITYIIISDLISHCVTTYLTQHPYFIYTHVLDVLSFCNPAFCTIYHRGSNHRYVELVF